MLCGISTGFPVLFPSVRQVAHVLLARPPLMRPPKGPHPFDLNVLCTPPAFTLSQDQTLYQKSSIPRSRFALALFFPYLLLYHSKVLCSLPLGINSRQSRFLSASASAFLSLFCFQGAGTPKNNGIFNVIFGGLLIISYFQFIVNSFFKYFFIAFISLPSKAPLRSPCRTAHVRGF